MKTANSKLRTAAKEYGIALWMLADELGISEASMTRLLRKELPAEKQGELMSLIEKLAEGRG